MSRPKARRRKRPTYAPDPRGTWRPKRQRPPKRAVGGAGALEDELLAFGFAIALLAKGAPLGDAMRFAFGDDAAGRIWQRALRKLLDPIPTDKARRGVLSHFLRWFSFAQLHGSKWGVTDAKGYVGRQHELRSDVEEVVDPETGEVVERAGELRLRHVPANSRKVNRAGGLSVHDRRCPHRLNQYRQILRAKTKETPRGGSGVGAVVRTRQPPKGEAGAVMPRTEGACWAYAQAWLMLPPSPTMLQHWGMHPALVYGARERAADSRATDHPDELRERLRELRELDDDDLIDAIVN